MADIRVSIPDLERFKEIVNRNGHQFGEIRQKLSSHLRMLRSNEWETEGARDFDGVFQVSEKDILNLERIMQEFVTYLNRKIKESWDIDSHKVGM